MAVITLFGLNRSADIMSWHKKVMVDHFKIPVNYIECPFPSVSHGQCMNHVLEATIDVCDSLTHYYWLDNDCVHLSHKTLHFVESKVQDGLTIFGHAWQSNHKTGPNGQIAHPYASQACLVFPKAIFSALGRPDMDHHNPRSDTSEELTYAAKAAGYNVSLLYPSHSVLADTPLDNGMQYGIGNTYGPLSCPLWHHTSRTTDPRHEEVFIETCKMVLAGAFDLEPPHAPYLYV